MTPEPVGDDKGENENFGNQNLSMNLVPQENYLKCRLVKTQTRIFARISLKPIARGKQNSFSLQNLGKAVSEVLFLWKT